MVATIKITKILENDLFLDFEGILLSENSLTVTCSGEGKQGLSATVNKGDKISICIEVIKSYKLELDKIYNVSFIPQLYDKNNQIPVVFVITKVNS